MMEGLLTLVRPASAGTLARDLLDVAIVAYAIYRLMLLLRGTRAVQVSFGLGLVVVVYLLAHRTGLTTTYTLLDRLLGSFFLVVVVLFQGDLRRAFMRVGTRPWFVRFRKREEASALEEVVEACTRVAQKRIGALIVFERDASLDDFVQQGTQLDAEVTSELPSLIHIRRCRRIERGRSRGLPYHQNKKPIYFKRHMLHTLTVDSLL